MSPGWDPGARLGSRSEAAGFNALCVLAAGSSDAAEQRLAEDRHRPERGKPSSASSCLPDALLRPPSLSDRREAFDEVHQQRVQPEANAFAQTVGSLWGEDSRRHQVGF